MVWIMEKGYTDYAYWSAALKSGLCKYLILRALVDKPLHGYEIIHRIDELTGHFYSPTEGAVYPILHEFEACGCVKSRQEIAHGRERRVYTLTRKGRESVQAGAAVWQSALPRIQRAIIKIE